MESKSLSFSPTVSNSLEQGLIHSLTINNKWVDTENYHQENSNIINIILEVSTLEFGFREKIVPDGLSNS
jgi:hypothetical protein